MDQIGGTDLTTTMLRTGSTVDQATDSYRLLGFTTAIRRTIDGVLVRDSHAWAQFNKNDDVVAEQVWWPALPGSVRGDIAAFRAVLADAAMAANFRAELPPDVLGEEGELAVHHPNPGGAQWYLEVTLDFSKRGRVDAISVNRAGARVYFATLNPPAPSTAQMVPTSATSPSSAAGKAMGLEAVSEAAWGLIRCILRCPQCRRRRQRRAIRPG